MINCAFDMILQEVAYNDCSMLLVIPFGSVNHIIFESCHSPSQEPLSKMHKGRKQLTSLDTHLAAHKINKIPCVCMLV